MPDFFASFFLLDLAICKDFATFEANKRILYS